MKPRPPCFAKDSGHPSGGKGAPAEPVTPALAGAAGSSAAAVASCPFGVPVTLTSATGESAIGIRSEYQPNWLDGNRNLPLPFIPVAWQPV